MNSELLNRRSFLVAGTGGAFAVWKMLAADAAPPDSQAAAMPSYPLPERPLKNPAFRQESVAGGTLLSTSTPGGELVAFRLNDGATRIWQSCDGRRSTDQIARVAAGPQVAPEEVGKFVKQLVALGLVVQGGYVRTNSTMVKV